MKLAALSALFALAVGAHAQIKPGDQFPALAAAGLTGAPLPDTAGKVVLVDFCASWCAPCRASFPTYSKLQAEYGPRGFVIVAVSVDDQPANYAAFVKKLHPGFVVVNDAASHLVSEVKPAAMPTSYLLDRSGKVIAVHTGYHSGTTEKELRQDLDRALGAASS
jgi:thiol-disulfide isomerase/thioredoxin